MHKKNSVASIVVSVDHVRRLQSAGTVESVGELASQSEMLTIVVDAACRVQRPIREVHGVAGASKDGETV